MLLFRFQTVDLLSTYFRRLIFTSLDGFLLGIAFLLFQFVHLQLILYFRGSIFAGLSSCEKFYNILLMQGLAAHLKRRNLKYIKTELGEEEMPSRTIHIRKPAPLIYAGPVIKYTSQTTFSPPTSQEPVKIVVQKELRLPSSPEKYIHPVSHQAERSNNISSLLQSKLMLHVRKGETPHTKKNIRVKTMNPQRKSRSLGGYQALSTILANKQAFVRKYFQDFGIR